jgi:hypothetical protein
MPKFEAPPIVHLLLDKPSNQVKNELRQMVMEGAWLKKRINNHTALSDLEKDPDAIWSLLVSAGLLAFKKIPNNNVDLYEISIINESVRVFLKEKISAWEKINSVNVRGIMVLPSSAELKSSLPAAPSAVRESATSVSGGPAKDPEFKLAASPASSSEVATAPTAPALRKM